MRKIVAFVLLVGAGAVFLFTPVQVFAHAYLLDSTPAQGETVQQTPNEVHLHFSEQVNADMVTITITNSGRQSIPVDVHLAPTDPSRVIISLPNLSKGTYQVKWSILSEDGHPVSGDFSFAYGQKVNQTAGESYSAHPFAQFLLIILRFLSEAGLLLVTGFAWIAYFAAKQKLPIVAWHDISKSKWLAPIIWLGLQVCIWFLYTSQLPENLINKWLVEGQFSLLLQVPFVIMLLVQAFLFLFVLIPNMMTGWYLSLWILITATFAFSGHTWSSQFIGLAMIAKLLHLWSGALWLGSLAYLLFVCVRQQQKIREALTHFRSFFSKLAFIASSLLILSGVLLVTVQTDWSNVVTFQTFWSRFLILKIMLVVGMLVYAALQNRQWKKSNTLERDSLRTEWMLGLIALLLGIWMSQIAYPIMP
ncbi:copper resistance CopC/CopD family protein [Shimazuella kribbensis]|uniref:copper resistance CopC/CopD family protein n=1 Tax=Shimazuella kribbensis TaxID=139808 RepID=UPI0004245D3C|nr:copper resistance protein CopC [Shimazuella kribbensis]